VRSLLEQGYYHVTGNTTFLGRPAISIADNGPAPSPDGGTATTSLIVDAATYFTLWREDRNIDMPLALPHGKTGKQQVDQIAETKVMELVDPAGVKVTIGSYPGAKVIDERPAAVARRKAAARRRAAAKCRKHHHSKRWCPQKGY
jgi:hypothetical protein